MVHGTVSRVTIESIAKYDGTALEIKVKILDPDYKFETETTVGTNPREIKGDYNVTVEVDGLTEKRSKTEALSKIAVETFNFIVSNKKTLNYTVTVNGVTHFWFKFENRLQSSDINFSLTLNESVDNQSFVVVPNTRMVVVSFSNDFRFVDGLFSGTAIINKTNTFDPFFDNEQLKLVVSVIDTDTNITISLQEFIFAFGNLSQVNKSFTTQITKKNIKVDLFVLTLTNDPMSLVSTKNFQEIEPEPEPEPEPTPDLQMTVTEIEYRRLTIDSEQGTVKGVIDILNPESFLGKETRYIINAKDTESRLDLGTKERFVGIGEQFNNRLMQITIPNFLDHPSIEVTWQILDFETLGALATFAQILTHGVTPPPPQQLNTSFTVTFFDATVQSFILTDEDFDLLITRLPSDDPNFFISTGVDTDLPALELETVIQAIEDKLDTAPKVPDPNSFSQDFTVVEYKATELGKSLFAQIQVTKLIDPPENLIDSFLQVLTEGKKVVNLEKQEINVAGVNQFAIVYDIPDLDQPTAKIFVQHFLQTKDKSALSDVIEVTRTIDIPVEPVPKAGDNFFSKIVGIWAGMTAGALMLSRRGN